MWLPWLSAGTAAGRRFFNVSTAAFVLGFWVLSQWTLNAQVTYTNGPGGAIPDATSLGENADNPDAGILTSDIVIADTSMLATFDSLTLYNVDHPFVGDLVIELSHLDTGTSVVLIKRPNKVSPTVGYGSSAAVQGDVTFITDLESLFDSVNSSWEAAANLSLIPGGTVAASDNNYAWDPPTSYQPTDLNLFAGESMQGTWRLTIRDEASGGAGSLGSWGFTAHTTPVPEPAVACFLLGIGVLVFRFLLVRKSASASSPSDLPRS